MAVQPDHLSFAHWLKRRRLELDLTQDRLAELVGYASPTIQKVERGERRPSRDLAARLADALAIPADQRDAFVRLARGPARDGGSQPAPAPSHAAPQPAALPLLRTRVLPPPVRRQSVARPRLTERLSLGQAEALTLVVAPAGWGKTTLLSSWVAGLPPEERARVAWLALDTSDSEPPRLLRYVIAALQRVEATLGAAALALLDTPQPTLDAALLLLANDLAELAEPLALILDDYHLLRAHALHGIVTSLLDHRPPQLRLIIATRESPPLPLGRLRARGQLHEIRADDLRFSADEAARLLNDAMGATLDQQAVAALAARTEGWAAGLQLAALALREQGDKAGFIHSFVGGHRLVLDYLADEVLDRLPAHLHTFLLQTSILDRLCGPLCDAVLGLAIGDWKPEILGHNSHIPSHQSLISDQAYSQLILDELERANLFLVPLDETQTWYRYHHLFGDVLRVRLRRGANPAAVMALHGRAASWYAAQGLWRDALAHAQAGQQWERAADALERLGDELLLQGAFGQLGQLVADLPAEARARHPRLLLFWGICELRTYNMTAAIALLTQAAEALGRAGDGAGRGQALLHLSDCQRSVGDFAAAHAALHEALASPLPPRARLNGLLSSAYEMIATGDAAGASGALDAALDLALEHDDGWLRFELAINAHSIVLVLPGGADWGERLCRSALAWNVPGLSAMAAALAWIRGYAFLLRGDLDAGAEWIDRAMAISAQLGGIAKLVLDAGFQQGRVAAVRGDLAAAEARLAGPMALLARPEVADYARTFGALHRCNEGWLRILQGRLDEARAIAAEMEGSASAQEWPTARCARLLLRGLIAVEAGDAPAAEELLGAAAREQARFADAFILGDARVALARARLRAGQPGAALQPLAEALDDQARRGTPGVLLLFGARAAADLLRLAHDHGLHQELAGRLLRSLGEPEPPPATPAAPPDLAPPPTSGPDTLSAREREVLRLLARGAGNQAIADALVISPHTAKHHVTSILAKLGAANRTEAVARARSLGLV